MTLGAVYRVRPGKIRNIGKVIGRVASPEVIPNDVHIPDLKMVGNQDPIHTAFLGHSRKAMVGFVFISFGLAAFPPRVVQTHLGVRQDPVHRGFGTVVEIAHEHVSAGMGLNPSGQNPGLLPSRLRADVVQMGHGNPQGLAGFPIPDLSPAHHARKGAVPVLAAMDRRRLRQPKFPPVRYGAEGRAHEKGGILAGFIQNPIGCVKRVLVELFGQVKEHGPASFLGSQQVWAIPPHRFHHQVPSIDPAVFSVPVVFKAQVKGHDTHGMPTVLRKFIVHVFVPKCRFQKRTARNLLNTKSPDTDWSAF